jgi:hypothetical protein
MQFADNRRLTLFYGLVFAFTASTSNNSIENRRTLYKCLNPAAIPTLALIYATIPKKDPEYLVRLSL